MGCGLLGFRVGDEFGVKRWLWFGDYVGLALSGGCFGVCGLVLLACGGCVRCCGLVWLLLAYTARLPLGDV